MNNTTFSEVFKKVKFVLGYTLLILGIYLALTDDSVLNNGILGAGVLLAASQTKN
jgi:hypothetical protein